MFIEAYNRYIQSVIVRAAYTPPFKQLFMGTLSSYLDEDNYDISIYSGKPMSYNQRGPTFFSFQGTSSFHSHCPKQRLPHLILKQVDSLKHLAMEILCFWPLKAASLSQQMYHNCSQAP